MQRINGIIQHHDVFDFTRLFNAEKGKYIGIDSNDYYAFLESGNEIHSFIGKGSGRDRVSAAVMSALRSDLAATLMRRTVSVMLTIIHSPDSGRPITVSETEFISEFVGQLPSECAFVWHTSADASMGSDITAVVLLDVRAL
ncbi:MAG: hypothetical protein K2G01_04135 [Paramuribaculum sp.]|nr:hypothetical protein [Paramuribaculum sp.]